jgi:hypothetical protein
LVGSGDQAAAAIVAQRRGKMQGRDAERGAELDDRLGARAPRQHVEERAGLARDGERRVLQTPVEIAIAGLAVHQACPIGCGKIGERGGALVRQCIHLLKQTVEQRCERAFGERGHGSFRSKMGVSLCRTGNTTNDSHSLIAFAIAAVKAPTNARIY